MSDLINRQDVIDVLRHLPNDNPSYWHKCDVVDRQDAIDEIEMLPSADYHEFISFVLDEIWDEDDWELNYKAFPELVCRKLVKMGYVEYDKESNTYDRID